MKPRRFGVIASPRGHRHAFDHGAGCLECACGFVAMGKTGTARKVLVEHHNAVRATTERQGARVDDES